MQHFTSFPFILFNTHTHKQTSLALPSSQSCPSSAMSSIVQSMQKRTFLPSNNNSLPVSQAAPDSSNHQPCLRKRLSSLSLKLHQPISSSSSSSPAWSFPRSKSVSAIGEYAGNSIRNWWDFGWSWILSRKPVFTSDLEMNEEETRVLGSQNKGSLMHVLYKVKSEFRKLVGLDNVSLPQTYKHGSFSARAYRG